MTRLVTQDGLKLLQDELEERTITIRQEIAGAIKEAKDQGDLSENAEYSAAKERQAENEQRILELEMIMKDVEVVEHNDADSSVQIGSIVTTKVKGKEMNFEIVGTNETDPAASKISNESPIGKALMGSNRGDKVSVNTPSGEVIYEVMKVK
jgi:transcription elongation factor GreA